MYGATSGEAPARRGAQLAFAFAVIASALVVAIGLVSYSQSSGQLHAISLASTSAGNEYLVASALMKHAQDKAFDSNPPVSTNIADLAKEAEDEMKLDAEVMSTGKIP
eukprot:CAMPEP_0173390324 /NCGR_PEP_ID=MMETSP1356-20130122/14468_1 /TAXON_ID=77927 ORGANISM="Hemiselmis virescens, Strain PCC157" /NCGR_SAMPLE_ID=MMETSP1356 /ASSEMBLY_ACC=CAM_ASM_000847 /LENGTH=107 /DNA_ID=CAMNT_0014347677 /DNA_START=17 /DNA_END=340 /DNA_ORIENTATION=-